MLGVARAIARERISGRIIDASNVRRLTAPHPLRCGTDVRTGACRFLLRKSRTGLSNPVASPAARKQGAGRIARFAASPVGRRSGCGMPLPGDRGLRVTRRGCVRSKCCRSRAGDFHSSRGRRAIAASRRFRLRTGAWRVAGRTGLAGDAISLACQSVACTSHSRASPGTMSVARPRSIRKPQGRSSTSNAHTRFSAVGLA